MNDAPLIRLQGVGKSFGEARVLEGIDLDVANGEFLGLVGPNGAGKSTLLKTIFALTKVVSGTVSFEGPSSMVSQTRLSSIGRRFSTGP